MMSMTRTSVTIQKTSTIINLKIFQNPLDNERVLWYTYDKNRKENDLC